MQGPVAIFDNFLADPEAVRAEFLRLTFSDVIGPADGATYKRVSVLPPNQFEEELSKAVGKPVKQRYSVVRLNYAGEFPNQRVHSDDSYDRFAAVLYLNRPEDCKGGTAFWKHKKTGWEFLPTNRQVRSHGKSPDRTLKEIVASADVESDWEQTRLAEMKFNRVIVYPTSLFHSRYPFEAFGSTPEDGRLIFCSFFNVE